MARWGFYVDFEILFLCKPFITIKVASCLLAIFSEIILDNLKETGLDST